MNGTQTVKRQSTKAIAAAKTRALKRAMMAAAAGLTEEQALDASNEAHHKCVAAFAHKQAVQDTYGYVSDEAAEARRAYVAADQAAMVARCVYAWVKDNARYGRMA